MKSFHFPLETVLRWRRSQFELEESRLQQLTAELRQIDELRSELECARDAAGRTVLKADSIDGSELARLDAYLLHLGRVEETLLQRRSRQEGRIAEQQPRLLEARRRLRLIEKLRERRFKEWQYELNREIESFAAEAYLVQWNKRAG